MRHADVLLTFAEIAVAVAGFASLISLLSKSPKFIDGTRLLGMVRSSLLVTAFSLFPFVPNALGISGAPAWRISAAVFLVTNGLHTFFAWRNLYRMWRKGLFSIRAGYFTFPMGFAGLVLTMASAFATSEELTSGLYLASLAALLSVSGVLFLSVFTSFVLQRSGGSSA
jgi:hypothetical protein